MQFLHKIGNNPETEPEMVIYDSICHLHYEIIEDFFNVSE